MPYADKRRTRHSPPLVLGLALHAMQHAAIEKAALRQSPATGLAMLADSLTPGQVEKFIAVAFSRHGAFRVVAVKGRGVGQTVVKIQCQNCVDHGSAEIRV